MPEFLAPTGATADLLTWWPDEHFDPQAAGIHVHADLENADLRGCYLKQTDLTGISLRGAQANAFTEWPVGFDWHQAGVVMEALKAPRPDHLDST